MHLTEVVRCSKRIVAGAMAFQLGGEKKLLTSCHHEVAGPPLKSYIFNAAATGNSSEEDDDAKHGHNLLGVVGGVTKNMAAASKTEDLYCENICKAVAHVRKTFPGTGQSYLPQEIATLKDNERQLHFDFNTVVLLCHVCVLPCHATPRHATQA